MAIDRRELFDWLDKGKWIVAKSKEYKRHCTTAVHKHKDPEGKFEGGYYVSAFSTESDDTGCLAGIDHRTMDETELHNFICGMDTIFLNTKREAMKEIKETLNYIKDITTIMG